MTSTLTTHDNTLTSYCSTLTTYGSALTTYYSTYVFPLFQIHPNNIIRIKTLIVCSHRIGQVMFK